MTGRQREILVLRMLLNLNAIGRGSHPPRTSDGSHALPGGRQTQRLLNTATRPQLQTLLAETLDRLIKQSES